MDSPVTKCDILAGMLKGKGKMEDGVCSVTVDRKDIEATIGNKPYHSLRHMFNFEPADSDGNALITGEMVLLETEVHRLTTEISDAGIIIGAIHNHFIYENPRLMYIHIETFMTPATFAATMARILYK